MTEAPSAGTVVLTAAIDAGRSAAERIGILRRSNGYYSIYDHHIHYDGSSAWPHRPSMMMGRGGGKGGERRGREEERGKGGREGREGRGEREGVRSETAEN